MLRHSFRALLAVLVLALISAAPTSAQEISPVLQRVASAWHKGDAGASQANTRATCPSSLIIDHSPFIILHSGPASAIEWRMINGE